MPCLMLFHIVGCHTHSASRAAYTAAPDRLFMRVVGRLAESEDQVLFATYGEVDKCEFIKANAPEDAWASTDDGDGILVKVEALREQAREVLVSAAN